MADFYDPPEQFEAVVTCRDLVLYVPPEPEPPTQADDVPTSALEKLSVQPNDGSGDISGDESGDESEDDDGLTFEEALEEGFKKNGQLIDVDVLNTVIAEEQKEEAEHAESARNKNNGNPGQERFIGVGLIDKLHGGAGFSNRQGSFNSKEWESSKEETRKMKCPSDVMGERRAQKMKAWKAACHIQFLQTVLRWDFLADKGPRKPQYHLSSRFHSTAEYKETFIPFILNELWTEVEGCVKTHWKDKKPSLECTVRAIYSSSEKENPHRCIDLRLDLHRTRMLEDFEVVSGNLVIVGHSVINALGNTQINRNSKCSLAQIDTCEHVKEEDDNGNVHHFLDITLILHVYSSLVPWGEATEYPSHLAIESITNLISAEREYTAVKSITNYDSVQSILNASISSVPENLEVSQFYKKALGLTTAQAKAVTKGVYGRGFQMIQGPPGTGKTKTIVSLIRAIYSKNRTQLDPCACESRVLICAPSNMAVDEIVSRLLGGVNDLDNRPLDLNILRLGNMEKIPQKNRSCTLESKVIDYILTNDTDSELSSLCADIIKCQEIGEHTVKRLCYLYGVKNGRHVVKFKKNKGKKKSKKVWEAISDEINRLRLEFKAANKTFHELKKEVMAKTTSLQDQFIKDAHIICSTLSHAGSSKIGANIPFFDTIIIDEAAQATEPTTLIPLQYAHRKCVMVGDPKQLPPTVKNRKSVRMNYEKSLFARLFNHCRDIPGAITMLDVQFRMHPEISSFPSDVFYDSKLMNSTEEHEPFEKAWHHKNGALAPYSFFHVTSTHTRLGSSSINNKEISVVFDLFNYLITHYDDVGSVGVISPYKAHNTAMENFFRSRLPDGAMEKIAFNSVDGFQGQEKDVIIFSCVRGGTQGIGFLRDVRRLNVAITRAKSSLWIVGNSTTLLSDFTWSRLILDCQSRSCFHNLHRHDLWTYLRTRTRQPPGRNPRRAAVEGSARRNRIYYD